MYKDPDHIRRVKKVSIALNIPEEVIELALEYTSEYIKKKIEEVELDREVDLTEEEFYNLLPVIKFPGSVGYLKPSYRKYNYLNDSRRRKEEKLKNK